MKGLRIIMLGKLRSGKSTAGQLLCETLKEMKGIELTSRPLAKPIYEEAKALYEKHGLVWRKNRRLLEGIGEALNDDYPNGDKIVELYVKNFDPQENIYVEDCRRLTQASFFSELMDPTKINDKVSSFYPGKTLFVRVNATDEVRKARCKLGEWAEGHVTDTELDTWPADFEIDNNSEDINVLKQTIRNLVVTSK